ncbi:hypothetical protein TGFOU_211150C, partial [Toxoplasma gondii FOU]
LIEGQTFWIPAVLRNLLFGLLVRRLSIRVAPRAFGPPLAVGHRALLQERLKEEQRNCKLQWLELECTDSALRLQTYEELSVSFCMRRCEVLHVWGSRAPGRSRFSDAGRGDQQGGRESERRSMPVVALGQLLPRTRHVLLKCMHLDDSLSDSPAGNASLSASSSSEVSSAAPSSSSPSPVLTLGMHGLGCSSSATVSSH